MPEIVAASLLASVVGFLFGLLGYASARRAAFRDFVAAEQRSVMLP